MKKLVWVGSSKKDLKSLPAQVINSFGYGLYLAQNGEKPENSKPLKGFGGTNVLEIIEDDAHGTYRAVYTIRMKDIVFVLHVFQKKSKHGIETPKQDIELIHSRLKLAEDLYKKRYKS